MLLFAFVVNAISFLVNFLRSTVSRVTALFSPKMSAYEVAEREEKPAPVFDPTLPSVPVAYPLKTLEELETRSYFRSFHYPFNVASVDLRAGKLPQRGRVLVCHDMQGGYVDDKWVQGGNNPDAYAIWHWHLIDVFVYFSHNLVTLPPPCWTNTAHRHGVQVLGTFIAEWDAGQQACNKLLATRATAQMYAERLVELAAMLGFDGWLLNLEVQLDQAQIPILKEFICHLTQKMHDAVPGSLVIWYDAVTVDGNLRWQNQLNDRNKPFFNLCDGLFTNYSWAESYAKNSAAIAGDRKYDVYMGIDVFGRNTYGGGQWTTNVALDVIKKADLSAAIFAPGWVYEKKQPDFMAAQNHWWSLVEKSWGLVQHYPKSLPFYSNFDQGHGYLYSVDGKMVSRTPWNNISRQSIQPFLEFRGDSKDPIQVVVDLKETSYSGGSSITFKGSLEDGKSFTARLFDGALVLQTPVLFTYTVKSEVSSTLGLVLEFSSSAGGLDIFVLVPRGSTMPTLNRLQGKSNEVIFTYPSTNLQEGSGWVTRECRINMSGHTLTKIHAICYIEKKPSLSTYSNAGFHAVLGDFTIKSLDHITRFPPASSWLVEGEFINWTTNKSSPDWRRLSVKIKWGLKNRDSSYFKYNIYTVKVSGTQQGEPEFIGTAEVRAFYVSDLTVPSGVSSVKFIVQLGGVDGAFQRLDESPFLLLQANDM